MTRILFVEDDMHLGALLKENLGNKGFEVVWCKDGSKGYEMFKKEHFHLCILDVMLPLQDGFSLSKEIRAVNKDIPIIFLTARSMQDDKIKGFELGCDDFITKPFNTQELYMRIHAILKRTKYSTPQNTANTLVVGKFIFDHTKMTLQIEDKISKLSTKEAELLYMLLTNKNRIVERSIILRKVWGNDDYFSGKSMDVYISKIRKMLKDDPSIEILNAYGIGFKLIAA